MDISSEYGLNVVKETRVDLRPGFERPLYPAWMSEADQVFQIAVAQGYLIMATRTGCDDAGATQASILRLDPATLAMVELAKFMSGEMCGKQSEWQEHNLRNAKLHFGVTGSEVVYKDRATNQFFRVGVEGDPKHSPQPIKKLNSKCADKQWGILAFQPGGVVVGQTSPEAVVAPPHVHMLSANASVAGDCGRCFTWELTSWQVSRYRVARTFKAVPESGNEVRRLVCEPLTSGIGGRGVKDISSAQPPFWLTDFHMVSQPDAEEDPGRSVPCNMIPLLEFVAPEEALRLRRDTSSSFSGVVPSDGPHPWCHYNETSLTISNSWFGRTFTLPDPLQQETGATPRSKLLPLVSNIRVVGNLFAALVMGKVEIWDGISTRHLKSVGSGQPSRQVRDTEYPIIAFELVGRSLVTLDWSNRLTLYRLEARVSDQSRLTTVSGVRTDESRRPKGWLAIPECPTDES